MCGEGCELLGGAERGVSYWEVWPIPIVNTLNLALIPLDGVAYVVGACYSVLAQRFSFEVCRASLRL